MDRPDPDGPRRSSSRRTRFSIGGAREPSNTSLAAGKAHSSKSVFTASDTIDVRTTVGNKLALHLPNVTLASLPKCGMRRFQQIDEHPTSRFRAISVSDQFEPTPPTRSGQRGGALGRVPEPSAKFRGNLSFCLRAKRTEGLLSQTLRMSSVRFTFRHLTELPHRTREGSSPVAVIAHGGQHGWMADIVNSLQQESIDIVIIEIRFD